MKHPVVETKTGWVWFTSTIRKSEFTNYGVGVTLYFQFLKFLSMMFLMLTILSVPAYIFYFSGTQSDDGSGDMKSFLGKLSLGNIGQSSYACNSATALGSEKFNLYCAYGTLSTIVEFGQSLKTSDS